ncbi:MAG TPA: uroporphyrinogen decarboxylase family protein [Candidatus Aminicenantes bacterium]|nr:uroporphyrinogen decarboxylase family protein [Candidatus Aminicenantes bacterium]
METTFARFVRDFPGRLAIPLCAYSGLEITGESVEDFVSVPGSQFKAVMALNDRYRTPVLLTGIDTTVEAEAYGAEVKVASREAPSIVGRLVTDARDIASLPDPFPGDARTRVPIETAWRLTAEVGESVPVLGAMLGPFALAARLYGVGETLAAAANEPETIESLLDIVTGFLCRYALAFRETGARGVLVVEAAAGRLLSAGLARFSAPFLKRIVKAVGEEDFAVIVHNGNAGIEHLDELTASGAGIYHVGPSMDVVAALDRVGPDAILGGNLDPVTVFRKGTPQSAGEATKALLEATRGRKNYYISTGYDLPPGTPLSTLNAFFRAVAEFNK